MAIKDTLDIVPRWAYIAFGLILYYLFRRNSGEYFINKALFEIIIFCLLYFASEFSFWYYRYFMPHVVTNNFTGSIGGRPVPVGDYFIFQCGEVFDPIHLKGKLATLVVPKNHMVRAGKNYMSRVFVQKRTLVQFPEIIQRYIYHHSDNFNINNMFFGEYTEEFLHINEELPEYLEERANFNKQINIRNRMIEGDNDLLVEQMETARELGEKSKFSGFLPFKKKKVEDEE